MFNYPTRISCEYVVSTKLRANICISNTLQWLIIVTDQCLNTSLITIKSMWVFCGNVESDIIIIKNSLVVTFTSF